MEKFTLILKNLIVLFSFLFLASIFLTSCNDKCDDLAKEFDGFTVKIRPSFFVEKETEGGEYVTMGNLALEYEIFKMHCEGYTSDVFNEQGGTDFNGIFAIYQSFTCEIVTPEDYVVLRLYDQGSNDAFYEKKLFPGELRDAQGFFGYQLAVDYTGVW